MIKATILGFKLGGNNNIKINIEYDINGKKVLNPYLIDCRQLIGKDASQLTEFVDTQINFQIDRYIEAEFRRLKNDEYSKADLSALVNKQYVKESAEIKDANGSVIVIKDDGTFTPKV